MQPLARWTLIWAWVGSSVLVPVFIPAFIRSGQVLALPEDEIVGKLRAVPVFILTNAEFKSLVATPPNSPNKSPVAGAFISHQDAQTFLETLKTRNPELAKHVRVVAVSMGEIYKLSQKDKTKPGYLAFTYMPMQKQVDTAVALLKQSGQQVKEFNGVPLFVARGGQDKGYLTIQQGNQQIIPLFFKKEELQILLERVKKTQPKLAANIDIQVLNMEELLKTLKTDNNPKLQQISFKPTTSMAR
jgi:nickel transport protein